MKYRWLGSLSLILVSILIISSCSKIKMVRQGRAQTDVLKKELDTIFSDPEFSNAHWGVVIQSLKNGEYLYQKNAHKNFMPASNMKLFTTATALAKLGPDYTYKTQFFTNGGIDSSGVLSGDIIIRGVGDPTITGRYFDGHITQPIENWADSLIARGITTINGNLIGDDNFFDDEILGEGWAWDYQSDWYAAQISALSFNDNCMDVLFLPGSNLGDEAKFQLLPDIEFARIKNHVTTVQPGMEKGISFFRKRGTNDVEIYGALALNSSTKKDWFSIENPTRFTVTTFKNVLLHKGIKVTGNCYDIDDFQNFGYELNRESLLFQHSSMPMKEIVATINKVSQNLYAELLLRTLGAYYEESGSSKSGIKVVKDFLAEIGIDPEKFSMYDGSGLSRLNMVTPCQVATLLRHMRKNVQGDFFYDSLPIAGVDGSIKNRMKHTAAEGNARAKTGYIGHVRALSGYVTTIDNEELVFSIIANNYTVPTSKANLIQDHVCERLANFSRYQNFSN